MQKVDYTSKIVSKLPYWFAMKKQPSESIGKAFLRSTGLELDEIFSTLDYMYEQISIDRADTEMMSECYKTILPDSISLPLKSVTGDGTTVYAIDNISDFYNFRSNMHSYEALKNVHAYYIDQERKILYSRNKYSEVLIVDAEDRPLYQNLHQHQIWNYFDEFGLLLNVPRLTGEDNLSYRNRLKDVFRNPSSSTYQGLVNGIARELGCRVEMILDDSSKDLEIQESMVVSTHITSEKESVPEDRLVKNVNGKYVLLGDADHERKHVSYVHSIETHRMTDYIGQEDIPLENELFYSNGKSTLDLKRYAEQVNELCPIMWNYARWDESHWIQDMSSFGYVPSLYDASIEGFRDSGTTESILDQFQIEESVVS